ncbi:carbohydrate ABC transporter permease [Paenibacillus thalictri]|uniref:Sugar ABC transporter permease n=1 Tax=Paenibacillus thalictri TaxID=2527873 RepID=A0A4Q9DVM2_9BACL|nr:sugar ABC transporter permease [Paenibacillus thalictri]TBL81069.1 sugar ABC transporter permease [Paenibacillus thalictri]
MQSAYADVKPNRRAKSAGLWLRLWRKNKWALLFLSPWFLGLVVFSLVPISLSLYFSFTSYDLLSTPHWSGMDNYKKLLVNDTRFIQALKVTCQYVFIGVPLQLIMALSLALALNKGIRGLSVLRGIYYIPSLLGPSVAIALLWRQIFGQDGVFNHAAGLLGIASKSWISDPNTSLFTLIALLVWQFGSPMVIFLAGLKQIPGELYEAADIDGASKLQSFLRITLPSLSPVLFFNLVMQMINSFQSFTSAYIVTNGSGGALDSALFYTLYLYISAFSHFEMGYASAMAWVLLIIIAAFTALLFLTSRKWVHYES